MTIFKTTIFIFILLIGINIDQAIARNVTLKIATLSPNGSTWMNKMRAGAKEIKTITNGRVKFKFYPGGVMGNDSAVLRKIKIGQLHGGAFITGSLANIYPDINLYSIPFKFNSFNEVDFVRKELDETLTKGLEKAGFTSFGISEGGFSYIMSNSKVEKPSDLPPLKVWIPDSDPVTLATVKELGINPVPLGLADVLTALQTDLIDTVATSPIAAIALQWHTRVSHMTNIPLTYLGALMAIDNKAFKKISKDDQKVVRHIMGKIFAELNQQNRIDNEKALLTLKKEGIIITTPTPNDKQKWDKNKEVSWRVINEQNIYSPNILEKFNSLLTRFRNLQTLSTKNNNVQTH